MVMGKYKLKFRMGTQIHSIYEAVITHPQDTFTSRQIWTAAGQVQPNVSLIYVQNTFSRWAQKGFLEKTGEIINTGKPNHILWRIKDLNVAAVKVIGKIKETAKAPNDKDKNGIRKKSPAIKQHGLPPQVDALQLGEAIIDYINHLQNSAGELKNRISQLGIQLREMKSGYATELQKLQKEVDVLRYRNNGLVQTNAELTKKINSRRLLNTAHITEYQKNKRSL
jgi:hypothetical protein